MSTTAVRRLSQIARQFSTQLSSLASTTMSSASPSSFPVRNVGAPNTLGEPCIVKDYRVYTQQEDPVSKKKSVISPWHDIELFADLSNDTILNMVVEVPRWSNAKMEISKEELFNPIKQDIKRGKLRFVRNCFPHHGYIWNYGALPQTWEDPSHMHPETKANGDNDPLDVCEIGEQVGYVGQVKQVKVLGIMALLDEGETDWKVIVVDITDPLASKLNDIEDVERHLPGLIRATNEWFRIYKIPDGKPENAFAFSGEAKNKTYAMAIVRECHEAWKRLMKGEAQGNTSGLSLANVTRGESADKMSTDHPKYTSLPEENSLPAEPIDAAINKWFYISSTQV